MNAADKCKVIDALLYIIDPYRAETMKRYLSEVPKNKELTEKVCNLADGIETLGLTAEQKETVDNFMQASQELQDLQLSVIYIAGMVDALVLLKDQGMLDRIIKYMLL